MAGAHSLRPTPIAKRHCDGCTLCCTLLSVEELEKSPGTTCVHCREGRGCKIYDGRPTECRGFFCQYLLDEALGEEWRPSRSHIVVAFEDYTNSIVIHVDRRHPDAWQSEPFASQIKAWAALPVAGAPKVIVWQGDQRVAIEPDLAGADSGVVA